MTKMTLGKRATLLCITLILVAVLGGCGPSGPSHSQARNAIWDYVQTRVSHADPRYIDVQDVEIVDIGEKSEVVERLAGVDVWPARLYLIKPGSRVKCEASLYKNSYGEWEGSIVIYDAHW